MKSKKKVIGDEEKAIGARIRLARIRLDVSITDLGLAYGGKRQTAQFWEKGTHFPPLKDFPRLCDMLRIDANQILGMEAMKALTEQEKNAARFAIQTAAAKAKSDGIGVARPSVRRERLRRRSSSAASARR